MTVGAYVLVIDLIESLEFLFKGEQVQLAPGRYVYCGSAKGPGGIEARVARHRKRDKKKHWHIDEITTRAGVTAAGMTTRSGECDLAQTLMARRTVHVPIPGFGASDCMTCLSHFLKVPKSFNYLRLGLTDLPAETLEN